MFNIFSLSSDLQTTAPLSTQAFIDPAPCALSSDMQNAGSPGWFVLLLPLCLQLPHNPESTLLQSLLKSDILIKSLALVTTTHISTIVDGVRSHLMARWSCTQLRNPLQFLWVDSVYLLWPERYVDALLLRQQNFIALSSGSLYKLEVMELSLKR
jgi:hypothetical protein